MFPFKKVPQNPGEPPDKTVPDNPVPFNSVPNNPVPDNPVPDNPVPDNPDPDKPVPTHRIKKKHRSGRKRNGGPRLGPGIRGPRTRQKPKEAPHDIEQPQNPGDPPDNPVPGSPIPLNPVPSNPVPDNPVPTPRMKKKRRAGRKRNGGSWLAPGIRGPKTRQKPKEVPHDIEELQNPGEPPDNPVPDNPVPVNPVLDNPVPDNLVSVNPVSVNPVSVNPVADNPVPTRPGKKTRRGGRKRNGGPRLGPGIRGPRTHQNAPRKRPKPKEVPHDIEVRGKKKKNIEGQNVHAFNMYKPGKSTQFQAPHHNEPEDLSDDLAPNMAAGQQQPGAQPQAVPAENKLNFKFQRTTQQKTPDWSEYQNKFKRIGGGSPDLDPDVQEVKQEPKDQAMNTGSTTANPSTSQQQVATSTQNTQKSAPKPVEPPKGEQQKNANQKSTGTLNTINVRVRNASSSHTAQPQVNISMLYNSVLLAGAKLGPASYPKGIPKSFLTSDAPLLPGMQGYHFPAGIPRSFLTPEHQRLLEMRPQPNPNPADPDFQANSVTNAMELPSWILPAPAPEPQEKPLYGELTPNVGAPQMLRQQSIERPYSPTDVYSETKITEEDFREGSESPDLLMSNLKRQSAFSRLGPLTQPKKPKLTINLQLNKDQAVREVLDESDESYRYIPVHLRKDVLESEDEIVKKYLPFWPWKKSLQLRKTASARNSKSAMLLEQEQMEAGYEKDNLFIQVVVKGYPQTWNKEDVLDAVLECVKGRSFIPLFIQFTSQLCKFFVIRSHAALVAIHRVGFCIRKDDVELTLSISLTDTGLNQIDLIPRLLLRRRLMIMSDDRHVDLTEFLIEKDVSNFIYFPLNRPTNQRELIQLQSTVAWEYLTELNLSRNRLTSLDGFDLQKNTPRLKHLDLSHNYLDKATTLLPLRDLPLKALKLEGNPLCHDYIDSAHYVKVVRMMFHEVRELDGVRITLKGDLPPMKRNYCPEAAAPVVEKFLETFFPLLEAPYDDRAAIEDLYSKDAVLTVTFRYKLRYGAAFRYFRNLFLRARNLEEGETESIEGASSITSLICKWPDIEHDRYTISVDVLHHDDFTTIIRLGGVLKLTAKSLAEDEHLLTFTRNVVLHTRNGAEYKIYNEMLYWDVPREEVTRTAFNITTIRPKQLSLKLESPPDEDLKSKLTDIFVKLADIDKTRGARCLELRNWDLRSALEYYISLLKLDDLGPLSIRKDGTTVPQVS